MVTQTQWSERLRRTAKDAQINDMIRRSDVDKSLEKAALAQDISRVTEQIEAAAAKGEFRTDYIVASAFKDLPPQHAFGRAYALTEWLKSERIIAIRKIVKTDDGFNTIKVIACWVDAFDTENLMRELKRG